MRTGTAAVLDDPPRVAGLVWAYLIPLVFNGPGGTHFEMHRLWRPFGSYKKKIIMIIIIIIDIGS